MNTYVSMYMHANAHVLPASSVMQFVKYLLMHNGQGMQNRINFVPWHISNRGTMNFFGGFISGLGKLHFFVFIFRKWEFYRAEKC